MNKQNKSCHFILVRYSYLIDDIVSNQTRIPVEGEPATKSVTPVAQNKHSFQKTLHLLQTVTLKYDLSLKLQNNSHKPMKSNQVLSCRYGSHVTSP